jgi:hypothetical protein
MTKVVREWSGGTGEVKMTEDKTYPIDDPTPHDDWNNLTATIRLFTYRSTHDPNIVMMEFTRRVWVPMAVVADLQALLDDQAVSHRQTGCRRHSAHSGGLEQCWHRGDSNR